MDLGVRVQGSVPGHETGSQDQPELGSGFSSKQERSVFDGEDIQRSSKLTRTTTTTTDGFSSSSSAAGAKTLSFHQGIPLLGSTSILSSDPRRQEHMLSFDNIKTPVSPYLRNPGYGLVGGGMMNNNTTSSIHGTNLLSGVKGPFSLTQWAELEQQALIYKYITANVPIPSTLLLSLKKSFFPYGSFPPNSYGWGSFHLGFSGGNMDPEPGRCRRTDGKKWRCSRDAVPDQKYCERHINRGRHRSRKPVEGLNGHNTTNAAAAAAVSKAARTSAVAMRGFDNNNIVGTQRQANQSIDSLANSGTVQNSRGASVFPTLVKDPRPKQSNNNNPFEFGIISSDSLLNPSPREQASSYANSSKGFGSYLDFSNQAKVDSWPEELKSDWTQLSMSIPMAAPSSPVRDKLAPSPLRLSSREFDPTIDMGLGGNTEFLEPERKANNWIPISWGSNNNSMGGPLGEVLNSTTNSPKFGSSPTGVLQKSTFGSLSNSSSGSSTVLGEGKDPLGQTTLMNSSSATA